MIPKLLGEQKYFSCELQRLIDRCNVRLKKAFDIRRDYLKIREIRPLYENERVMLFKVIDFIRTELVLRKQHQNKLNKAKYINN